MSTYRLNQLFAPRSVALAGASPRENSIGRTILRNLREGGFAGSLSLVNPNYAEIEGIKAVPRISEMPAASDLLIIATPPYTVPQICAEAAAKGCPATIIITAGLGHGAGSLAEAARQAAHARGMRILGPNCLGILVPRARLNASFATRLPKPGNLALISQSGAIAAGLNEWAIGRSVGFSAIVSLGDKIDIDFGDLLDFFALDPTTRAILLYIESINDARKFMSAARAAARTKPVVVIKSGRHAAGATAARTHTGALAGSDAVYDAAFRRAGLVRVFDLQELFAAAETLGRIKPFPGKRLAILTNGGGVGVLAVDRLIDLGGTLAAISPETRRRLDQRLPPIWSHANPVDIAGDADSSRYRDALEELLADRENDAILIMNVPTALASASGAARAVAEAVTRHRGQIFPPKPVFATWIGSSQAAEAELEMASIPYFAGESDAVRGFMHLVRYHEALEAAMETPPSMPAEFGPDLDAARGVIDEVLRSGRTWLDPLELNCLFAAYSIPITPALLARNPDEAAAAATPWLSEGKTVAVKILSPDIVHKSEVNGVRLNLTNENAVREAAAAILIQAHSMKPDARISGITIHPMIFRPKARELIAGIADDATFGPILVFGSGGTAVEVIDDKALALPPLDRKLARDLIARTRVSRMLRAYRNVPAADETAIALILIKLAQMVVDFPEIRELDLNPILADQNGVIVVDARAALAEVEKTASGKSRQSRFAIRPYPKDWERQTNLTDGTPVSIRPVRPEDERLYPAFLEGVTAQDLRLRFFGQIKEFGHAFIARLTQIDYARAMAFIAVDQRTGALLGVVRLHASANYDKGEYAVLVRSDLKGKGLGWTLMKTMLDYARAEGIAKVEGQVLRENTTMLAMCAELGFTITPDPSDSSLFMVSRIVAHTAPNA